MRYFNTPRFETTAGVVALWLLAIAFIFGLAAVNATEISTRVIDSVVVIAALVVAFFSARFFRSAVRTYSDVEAQVEDRLTLPRSLSRKDSGDGSRAA